MYVYENFIKENVALLGAKKIGVYKDGERLFGINLNSLSPKANQADKLYSFGALSDVHIQYETGYGDIERALNFLTNTENVSFTCICGDLTRNGLVNELQQYKDAVSGHIENGYKIYAIAGNHEGFQPECESVIETYTGYPLYYAVTKNTTDTSRRIYADSSIGENDVFIFVGNEYHYYDGELLTVAEMQWLYEILEEYRNKRCFLFQHLRPNDASGNAYGIYGGTASQWNNRDSVVFGNLLKHYRNVIFFHGHSHLEFALQTKDNLANYDNKYGMHSIHIPSITMLRTGDESGSASKKEVYEGSEGYVVDVYENGIHLRGRDFASGEFLPIASYWLDTTLTNIEAGTFTDTTGTIKT